MAVELRVRLDPAQQLPAITLASARRPVFFGAPVAVGEPDCLAAGSSPLVQEAINPCRDHHRVVCLHLADKYHRLTHRPP